MGAVATKNGLIEIAAVLGGVIVGRIAAKKILPSTDAKIKGTAMAGIGIFAAGKIKSPIVKSLLTGFAVSGGELVFTSLGVISGIENMPFLPNTTQRALPSMGANLPTGVQQMVAGTNYARKGGIIC